MFAREQVRGWDTWGLEVSTGIGRRRWKSNAPPRSCHWSNRNDRRTQNVRTSYYNADRRWGAAVIEIAEAEKIRQSYSQARR